MKRLFARLLTVMLALALVGVGLGAWAWQRWVVAEPGPGFTREAILEIIAQESPVTYRDGVTPLGVFFSREHRIYVGWKDLPQDWVRAIVAAEDQNYWDHRGIDPEGLLRAVVRNLRAGRVVAGGSTLTQQTAKNLFYRPDRSVKSKAEEALQALRLERHFTKEDILEFYANQFHVSANGRGIGVAARYFFDKQARDLTLHECAFIAGMVKAPAWYNPWVGTTAERRDEARARARARTAYVLRRMAEEGMIAAAEAERLSAEPIPFQRGTFQYESNVVLDEVQRRIERSPFPELLAAAGIDNPSTAGLTIVTTLDPEAQRAALYGLWHHLTEVGPALEGLEARQWLHDGPGPRGRLARAPAPRDFLVGRVVASRADGVAVDLGGYEGLLDEEALTRAASILARAAGRRGPSAEEREALGAVLQPDAVVRVSVRPGSAQGALLLDLERAPELQGGLWVERQGEVLAVVGGHDNQDFNRATVARRQLGSTWKVPVLAAALQLGWTPTDLLDNRDAVFPFEGTWYYPRADHVSEPFVSLAWAGVRSENLATVWLLVHLVDRLNAEQLRRLAELVDLARRPEESEEAFRVRLRDALGVLATEDRREEMVLQAVKGEVITDLGFLGHPEEAVEIRSLHHGRGFAAEIERVKRRGGPDAARKLRALEGTWLHLAGLVEPCVAARDHVVAALAGAAPLSAPLPVPVGLLPGDHGTLRLACGRLPAGVEPLDPFALAGLGALAVDADVLLDDRLHLTTVRALGEALARGMERFADLDPYDPRLIVHHPDFRSLLAIRYLQGLATRFGVAEGLPLATSLPLGAADVTLEEMAGLYAGLLTGTRHVFPGEWIEPEGGVFGRTAVEALPDRSLLIAEIRDREGRVLYRATPQEEDAADSVAGRQTLDILRNVVEHGTGQRARGAVPGWPLAGKTGTTNDYRNAAFVGAVPVLDGGVFDPSDLVIVAAYVGYDDNRRMARGGTRLQGSSGALPAWIAAVQGLAVAGLLGSGAPPAEGLPLAPGEVLVPVMADSGLPGDGDASVLVAGAPEAPERRFAPYTERPAALSGPADEAPPAARPGEAPVVDQGSVWDGLE